MRLRPRMRLALASLAALALAASIGVTAGATKPATRGDDTTPVNGGILLAGIPDSPDHLDPGLSYTNEGWEIFEATNDGLLTFVRTDDPKKSATIVPDIATAMPTVSEGRPHVHVHGAHGRPLLAARQSRRAALRLQVHDRAPLPHQLGRRRLLHRHRRRERRTRRRRRAASRASSRTTRRTRSRSI